MRESLNENKTLIFLLVILAFAIVGAFYYYGVYPKSEERNRTLQTIAALEIEIEQLEKNIEHASAEKSEPENEFGLRKKLPEKREISQLLMSIQEIELFTESKITSVTFNDYDALVTDSSIIENMREESVEEEEEEQEDAQQDVDEEEIPHTNIDVSSLPDQLKLLSLQINVFVQDDDHLLQFIKEVEALDRVIRIDDIQFSKAGEEELSEGNPDESISVTIQLTTFYSEIGGN